MAFDPLGNFDTTAALDAGALAEGRRYLEALPHCPPDTLRRIYAHWTAGHFGQDDPKYNGSVRFDGQHFHLDIPHDPRDNAIGVNDNEEASHTFMRNTGAFGITTDDMVFATEHDFGPEPLTMLALEYLCAGIGAVAAKYGIDIGGTSTHAPYAGEPNVLTHAEAGDLPGNPAQYDRYGPGSTSERIDLASFVPAPDGEAFTAETATACGNALRDRAHRYKVELQAG
jgi:hypothetical protein